MLSLDDMIQHYKGITKPLVNENTVLLAISKMQTSPDEVLRHCGDYHISNVALLIKELKEHEPEVRDEDTLVLYIAYKLSVQNVLLDYDPKTVCVLKDILLNAIKVSGDYIDCFVQNGFVTTLQVSVNINAVKFNEFYAHYVKQYKYSLKFFKKCLSDALVHVKYSPEYVVIADEDLVSSTLPDVLRNIYEDAYTIVSHREFALYVLWRLYDEKQILLPKTSNKEWMNLIRDNIITVDSDFVVLNSVRPVQIYADSVEGKINPSVSESDISAAEQMHVLSNIAHYCVENDIGVLTFINDLFSGYTDDVNGFLHQIKSAWSDDSHKL